MRIEHLERQLVAQESELEGLRLGNSVRGKLEADLEKSARLVDQLNEESRASLSSLSAYGI